MYVSDEVDWSDEAARTRWMEAWKQAATSRDLNDGHECPAFFYCSFVTRIAAHALWKTWHFNNPDPHKPGVRFDAVSVEGETLADAVSTHLFDRSPTEVDVEQLLHIMEELERANLVLQRHPGRWDIHFGRVITDEERAKHEAGRARTRREYSRGPGGQLILLPSNRQGEDEPR